MTLTKEELLEIYRVQGYSDAEAQTLVDIKTRDRRRWLDAMMVEELGLVNAAGKPLFNGLATLIAFVAAGILPLVAYLLNLSVAMPAETTFRSSLILSGLSLLGLGGIKGALTHQRAMRSGMEMLLAGGVAAGIAYGVGALLKGLVGVG